MGSPPVRSSRVDVADQTSRLPSTSSASDGRHQQPVEARARGVRPPGGRAAAGADGGHQSSFRAGGRIEPSLAKTGQGAAAGVVPGIAALRGFTRVPSMP